jgi:hypothetical protein
MSKDNDLRCERCLAFFPLEGSPSYGRCRLHPPSIFTVFKGAMAESEIKVEFPAVQRHDWCLDIVRIFPPEERSLSDVND